MNFTELLTFEDEDSIEACRICGTFFTLNQAFIQPIFNTIESDDNRKCSMSEIIRQMNEWNLQVRENDGRPQYMCIVCKGEFQRMLIFKRNCLETRDQFDELADKRAHNGTVIKKEIDEETVSRFCGFIYLDTEDEEGSEEDGSRRVCAPFDIPHVPIKEEHTARIPQEMPYQPPLPKATNLPDESTFTQVQPEELAAANGFSSSLFEQSPTSNLEEDNEDDIIKFTYEFEAEGGALPTLPAPIHDSGIYCKLCGHSAPTEKEHTDHMNRVHMLKDCECHICGKKFSNAQESRFRFHLKWHKLQKHLKCPICGFFCNSKDTLKEHKLAVHTRSKCDYCGKQIKHKQLQTHLKRHIQDHEEEVARKLSFMQTVETPVMPAPSLIQCAFCECTVEDAEQLEAHIYAQHRTPPETSSAEPEVETTQHMADDTISNELEEKETSHSSVVDEMKSCTIDTPNSSPNSTNNNQQKFMHECHICGKAFDLNIKLNRHLKQHTKAPF